jgi:hypothetical protein
MQAQGAHDALEFLVVRPAKEFYAQPFRAWVQTGRVLADSRAATGTAGWRIIHDLKRRGHALEIEILV